MNNTTSVRPITGADLQAARDFLTADVAPERASRLFRPTDRQTTTNVSHGIARARGRHATTAAD